MAVTDVRAGGGGHGSGFRDAVLDEGISLIISRAVDWYWFPLPEFEFELGGVVGDGDGDGTSIGDDYVGGTRCGLDGVVDPNYLEPRDWVEGESSQATAREIVQGRHCQRDRLS